MLLKDSHAYRKKRNHIFCPTALSAEENTRTYSGNPSEYKQNTKNAMIL